MGFLISTKDDFATAAVAIADGSITLADIEFAEYITDSIKIHSNNFQSASLLDYHVAQLMLAAQQEIINLYSILFNEKIKLKNLDNFPFLILKFEINDGCVNILSRLKKIFVEEIFGDLKDLFSENLFKDMSPTQKIIALLIILALVGAFKAPDIIHELKANPEVADILDNTSVTDILSKNQLVPTTIINNLGDGYVEYNDKEYTAADYKAVKIKPTPHLDIVPVTIENLFFIQKYDFSDQKVLIFAPNCESFWASTKWLNQIDRDRLKQVTSEAIEKQTIAREVLVIACKIKNHKVNEAIVEHLGKSEKPKYMSFNEAIAISPDQPDLLQQGDLIDRD